MIITRFAEANDRDDIKRICEVAFTRTSLDVDPMLPVRGGDYLFRYYAEKAVERYPSHCFVAERRARVIGFIIFGVDADTGKRIQKKVGNIILFAVDPEEQGGGIGKLLLERVLSHFREHAFSLVNVGTDADNISALHSYEREGFRMVLTWGTFRTYASHLGRREDDDAAVTLAPVRKGKELGVYDFIRTHSFFYERRLPYHAIKDRNLAYLTREIARGGLTAFHVVYNRERIGFVTIREDPWLSESANTRFLRFEDIYIIPKYAGNDVITGGTVRTALCAAEYDVMEMWTAMNRRTLVNALGLNGFRYVHTATVLHLWMER